jgi:hypothetical protein
VPTRLQALRIPDVQGFLHGRPYRSSRRQFVLLCGNSVQQDTRDIGFLAQPEPGGAQSVCPHRLKDRRC